MAKNQKIIDTAPRRDKCGDCYYNGSCREHLRRCPYLKPKKEQIDEE